MKIQEKESEAASILEVSQGKVRFDRLAEKHDLLQSMPVRQHKGVW